MLLSKMRDFNSTCFERQFITRQYNDKCKFPDYNEVIKKLQCNYVRSFNNPEIFPDLNDYNFPVSTCKFSSKHQDVLAVANENGLVCIENVKSVQTLKCVQTHKNTVYDIAWMPGASQFVTVSGDNSAKLWDCGDANVNLMSTFLGHNRSVRCVSFKPENTSVFATGSRDGSLMIWDVRAVKKCAKFSHHLPDQIISSGAGLPRVTNKKNSLSVEMLNSKSVTGLIFQNDNTLISCGSTDRFIRVWDMRKTYSRSGSNPVAKYQLASPYSGFSYLCMNEMGTKLYANCMDSYIYCFNINSYDPDPAFYGHENGSFYVKSSVSTDGIYLMSGSSDENAYIWNTRNAELSEEAIKPIVVLSSHTAEVTCVEMGTSNLVIVTCSDDGTFRLWNPFTLKNNVEDKVDIAACYDAEKVTTVKTQWKNKRKFRELEDSGQVVEKSMECASHTKICRFYINNLSTSCICHEKFTQGKGQKRTNEGGPNEKAVTKKRTPLQTQECTPPRQSKPKHIMQVPVVVGNTPKRLAVTPTKVSSKRKLEDMPDFIEEGQKSKKMNSGRILIPSNLENPKEINKTDFTGVGVIEECKNSKLKKLVDDYKQPSKEIKKESVLSRLSSPTSNLPNYVEDGTSPYIHKCARIIQKENDWLTKLRKNYKVDKTPESKELAPKTLTPPSLEGRKKKSLHHTLHKYFKVSSKSTEKSYNSQEIQKKNILAKIEKGS